MAEAVVSMIPDMEQRVVETFVKKAVELDHELCETKVKPQALVTIGRDERENGIVTSAESIEEMPKKRLSKGDSICMDFGDHYVGYVSLKLASTGSPQDAPAFLRLKFAEIPNEILDDSSTYEGWISKGWNQEEWIHIDVLPCELKLPCGMHSGIWKCMRSILRQSFRWWLRMPD